MNSNNIGIHIPNYKNKNLNKENRIIYFLQEKRLNSNSVLNRNTLPNSNYEYINNSENRNNNNIRKSLELPSETIKKNNKCFKPNSKSNQQISICEETVKKGPPLKFKQIFSINENYKCIYIDNHTMNLFVQTIINHLYYNKKLNKNKHLVEHFKYLNLNNKNSEYLMVGNKYSLIYKPNSNTNINVNNCKNNKGNLVLLSVTNYIKCVINKIKNKNLFTNYKTLIEDSLSKIKENKNIDTLPEPQIKKINITSGNFYSEQVLIRPIDYYFSNPVARASKTMSDCRIEKIRNSENRKTG